MDPEMHPMKQIIKALLEKSVVVPIQSHIFSSELSSSQREKGNPVSK